VVAAKATFRLLRISAICPKTTYVCIKICDFIEPNRPHTFCIASSELFCQRWFECLVIIMRRGFIDDLSERETSGWESRIYFIENVRDFNRSGNTDSASAVRTAKHVPSYEHQEMAVLLLWLIAYTIQRMPCISTLRFARRHRPGIVQRKRKTMLLSVHLRNVIPFFLH